MNNMPNNKTIFSKVITIAMFLALLLTGTTEIFSQVTTPFQPRFQSNEKGDIQIFGNALLKCPAGNCGGNNNSYSMVNIDIDSDASTFNSSSANFTLPAGATVLWAGLYWNGISTNSARNTALFKTPASGGYVSLTGITYDNSYGYQGFKDVTSLVQAGGTGTYMTANVRTNTGTNTWAGWALVVVYRDPSKPQRNLTVFDGLANVSTSNANVNITISGFTTPLFGPVNVALGVVAYDGDADLTGDALKFNNQVISNGLNPASNFFNSTISRFGTLITDKNPNYANQLGLDIDIVDATGKLSNGQTSAVLNLTTGGESYNPGVVTTVIDIFAPDINITKNFTDLNGGSVTPGDTLLYTVSLVNNGQDAANKVVVVDSIQNYMTYLPGSMVVTSGANSGNKTDAAGDDQAFFASGKVNFNLGSGATSSTGGNLNPGESTAVSFKVVVDQPLPDSLSANNFALATYKSQSIPIRDYSSQSATVTAPIISLSDLSLTKTVSNPAPVVGSNIVYTVKVTNSGPEIATSVSVNDLLPSGLQFVSYSSSTGTYDDATGDWVIGTMNPGRTDSLRITVLVNGTTGITNFAEVKSLDQTDPDSSPNNGNPAEDDYASVSINPVNSADLKIRKLVTPANPTVGSTVTYTITVSNDGPGNATNVMVNDKLPAGISYVSHTASQGSYVPATGDWNIGTINNAGDVVLTLVGTKTSPNIITNIAEITAADQSDPFPLDRKDSATIPIQVADLSISKTVSPQAPQYGQQATFRVVLKNNGPTAATGVIAQDSLVSGLSYVSSTVTQGVYDPVSGEWFIGTIANGDSVVLLITVNITSSTGLTNTASIKFSHEIDPTLGDRTASVNFTAASSDLSILKTVDNANPGDGTTINYTITITNNGPSASTNSTVYDKLPNGLVYQSHSTSQGLYNIATDEWETGPIPSGGSATLHITAKVIFDSLSATVINLGPATGFNLFVLNDFSAPSSDVEGKAAIGRDVNVAGYSFGDKYPNSNGTEDILIVGRNLTYISGAIYSGNVVYGNSTNLPINGVSINNGTLRKDTVIDFAAAATYLQSLSTSISLYPVNGTTHFEWNGLELTGTNPFLNVFSVSGAQLSQANSVALNVPNGSAVLVNVSGTNVSWTGGLTVTGTAKENVIYNFYESTALRIVGIDIRGAVLAPFAYVTFPSGVHNGQMIAYNVTGSGQFNLSNFMGNIPINKDIWNVAEIMSADQYDPDSTPGNNDPSEDDYSKVKIHVTNIVPAPNLNFGNWNYMTNFGQDQMVMTIASDNTNNLFAGTLGGVVYKSTDNGTNWTQLLNTINNATLIWNIKVLSNGKILAATEQGIYISSDNGASWELSTLNGKDTRSIVVDSQGIIYVSTWGSGVYKSADNGNKWTAMNTGLTNNNINTLAINAQGTLFAGSFGDGVFRSNGTGWDRLTGENHFVWTLYVDGQGSLICGTYGSGVFTSNDNGSSWTHLALSSNLNYTYGITGDQNDNLYFISFTGGVTVRNHQTGAFNMLGLSALGVSSIYINQNNQVIVGTSPGYLYKNDSPLTSVQTENTGIPAKFELNQNFPNPFNPSTQISFAVPQKSFVSLKIYDVQGSEVATLVNEDKEPGFYSINFDAKKLSSGVYFYKVIAGDFNAVRKMILLK